MQGPTRGGNRRRLTRSRRYTSESLERRLLLATAETLSFAYVAGFTELTMVPVDAAVGDFDRDGKPDLAVVSATNPPQLHLFMNDGPGTFHRRQEPRTLLLDSASDVTAGDFNGDGNLDVAVIGWWPDSAIKIMFGNGNGTLAPTVEIPLGSSFWEDLVATDLNNDGRADLIVAGGIAGGVPAHGRVFRGNANNTFTEIIQANPFGARAKGLHAADVNNDGNMDLVLNIESDIVEIALGLGNLAFSPRVSQSFYNPDATFSDIGIGDFNHDGNLDLALSGHALMVALGNGSGAYGAPVHYSVGSVIRGPVAVADFDGDDHLDLAFGGTQGYFSVARGNGIGGFGNGQRVLVNNATVPAMVAADFSQDGKADLALVTPEYHAITSYVNVTKYPGILHGILFHDTNADRVAQPTETRLAGWQVYLDSNDNDVLDPGESYVLTQANGSFAMELLPDTYRVRVKLQIGHHQTTPAATASGQSGNHLVRVVERSIGDNLYFGVTRLGDIAGRVFYDANANGISEDSELGQQGWSVYVDANNDAVRNSGELSTTTSASGHYVFSALFPARYNVRIERPSGWKLTTPVSATGSGDGYWVTQVAGGFSTTYTDFGVIHPGFVSGRVYDDRNSNNGFDGGDVGLGGWYVFVDVNGNGTPDLAEPQVQSNASGLYTLTVPVFGTYAVKIIRPSGWQGTQPAGGFYTVTFSPESTATNRDFGNSQGPLQNAGFASAVNFPSLTNPDAVAVADFNNDGNRDFAVANNGGQLTVMLGHGDGTFTAAPGLPPGADGSPKGIVAADFDADGNIDLAVANTDSDNVSVLLGNGDGSFDPAVNYPAASGAFTLAAHDFNGDNKPDLVVTGRFHDGVVFLRNLGDGSFAAPVTIPAAYGATWVAGADFNNDGKQDLVTANNFSDSVSVMLGNDNGTFAAPLAYTSGVFSGFCVATGDFDGDGNIDIAVTNQFSDTVVVARGKGDGTFFPGTTYSVDTFPQQVVATDFDGDGKLDLAVACRSDGTTDISGSVSVLRGNGDGTFQNRQLSTTHTSPTALGIGLFNTDGRPDLVVANFYSDDVSVLLNDMGTPVGSIAGSVFRDGNADGIRQPAELALSGWTVYLDADDSGTLDAGERSAVSDFEGRFTFSNLPVGTYVLREVVQPNFARIVPALGYFSVAVAADQTSTDNDFGNIPTVVPFAGGGANGLAIRLDLAGNNIEVFANALFGGAPQFLMPVSLTAALSFLGGAGDDTLVIDLTRGNPFPAAGLTFAGAGGMNRIQLLGTGNGDTVTATATSLVVNNSTPMTFTAVGQIQSANLGAANVTVAAGSSLFVSSADPLSSLVLEAGAHVTLAPGLGTLVLGGLHMDPIALLDLADNALEIQFGAAASPAAAIVARIAAGYNQGQWNGSTGISSSTAAAAAHSAAVGSLDNGTMVLVKYTIAGDANLDARIDADDYFQIDSNYGRQASALDYFKGDFNYDGQINGDDYFIIDSNFPVARAPAPAVSTAQASASQLAHVFTNVQTRDEAAALLDETRYCGSGAQA